MSIKGGGVRRLMEKSILNFHFDFDSQPSLSVKYQHFLVAQFLNYLGTQGYMYQQFNKSQISFALSPILSPSRLLPKMNIYERDISLADRDWALGQDLEGDRKIVGKWFHRICLWLRNTSPPPPIPPAAPPR